MWYINHTMIVDANPSSRNEWLGWAKTRRIGEVYIAPHHGKVALVEIPVRRMLRLVILSMVGGGLNSLRVACRGKRVAQETTKHFVTSSQKAKNR